MDFYSSQDAALKRTRWLVVLFVLAVLSIIFLTNLLVMSVAWYSNSYQMMQGFSWQVIDWELFFQIGVAVTIFIALGSFYRIYSLSSGASVAELLRAERIIDSSGDPSKQKILNVVAEMAIASGTPVPPVYLLDEAGINAFAAGYQPSDAIIGVTRGAIDKLTRDQLQGVIAHEFSHILNGDMRLNIRLMGILFGIILIGEAGTILLRGTRKKSSGGTSLTLVVGVGLMFIGYVGIFFGNLIKAAVSRQREFLADASAVQFTRNPEGIAGALKRIGADSHGSILTSPKSSQISHSLFNEGVHSYFQPLFATHPPLKIRIKRILPYWDGKFDYSVDLQTSTGSAVDDPGPVSGFAGSMQAASSESAAMGKANPPVTDQASLAHLEHARVLLQSMPENLLDAIGDPFAARAAIYCLVLDTDSASRGSQLRELKERADSAVYETALKLYAPVSKLAPEHRLTLVELALPTLQLLSFNQYRQFEDNLRMLVEADQRVSLSEWMVHSIIKVSLYRAIVAKHRPSAKIRSLSHCIREISTLLSLIAHTGLADKTAAEAAFAHGCQSLGALPLVLQPREKLDLAEMETAIGKLAQLHPLKKPALLKACVAVIVADQKISFNEGELLRTIGIALDCPIPPLLLQS
jgi:Zn-dependent protease with chaperone function